MVPTAHNHGMKVTGHCRATEGIKNALRADYDTLERGSFMDHEALDLLLARNTPVVPALQYELASIEHGPEAGWPQAVIEGHQETLEGGAESARQILKAGAYGQNTEPRLRSGENRRLGAAGPRNLSGSGVVWTVERSRTEWSCCWATVPEVSFTLGGSVICRAAKRRLALSSGCTFFAGYGVRTGTMLNAICDVLRLYSESNP